MANSLTDIFKNASASEIASFAAFTLFCMATIVAVPQLTAIPDKDAVNSLVKTYDAADITHNKADREKFIRIATGAVNLIDSDHKGRLVYWGGDKTGNFVSRSEEYESRFSSHYLTYEFFDASKFSNAEITPVVTRRGEVVFINRNGDEKIAAQDLLDTIDNVRDDDVYHSVDTPMPPF